MAVIQRLMVDRFRNLEAVDLALSPGFNLFSGVNGSGKTSLLEAIHVLSVGRSFRTHKIDPLVNRSQRDFLVFADLGKQGRIGLLKSRTGKNELKYDGEQQRNWQTVAATLPLQVLNTESFQLLEGSGKLRRRFLDWAVFHVEHSYLEDWRAYRRGIAHRNSLLKNVSTGLHAQLDAWDVELAGLGQSIHESRKTIIESFSSLLEALLKELLPGREVVVEYKAGWDSDHEFATVLREQRARDIKYGMTLNGPHRADFVIKINGVIATELLSRGQLKMLVCALKIAMGRFVERSAADANVAGRGDYQCTYLIDDLASELDRPNRNRVLAILADSGAQCLLTAVEAKDLDLDALIVERSGKFHVEHGKIQSYQ
ncbi:MAG: DNA replication/repair protein RecF [Gammaproteobacteria bacterium]|mgnify:CR=1 FL=1|nr:DNA replication/repair protein RecF [Gammaproteobacteria bacterium]|tara:strand:- start:934 stop:2046 length:1113 start_codon:yes stop_codon:yes gene_type:complete